MYQGTGEIGDDPVVGFDERDALAGGGDLTVVHSPSDAGSSWTGRRGRIAAARLVDVLPPEWTGPQYSMCGSPPVMDAVEAALRHLGIPNRQIHSERFPMA